LIGSAYLFEASSSEWGPSHLARLLAVLRESRASCGEVARAIVDRFAAGTSPLRGSLLAIADAADRSGTNNAFHNSGHSRDVGTIWFNLALANNRLAAANEAPCGLTTSELLLGACAAFGHDIGHDGTSNNVTTIGADGAERTVRVPFRLETMAAERVCEILHFHGAGSAELEAARAVILATDIVDGHRALEAALEMNVGAAREPPGSFEAFKIPAVRLIAAILRDADLMPSSGLTAREYDRYTALFEAEAGVPRHSLGPSDAEGFFDGVLCGRFLSPPGRLFQSRLDALRALNRIRLSDKGLQGVGLESVGRDLTAAK